MLVQALAVVAVDPELANATVECEEEIPKLLFADMQQEDEENVVAAGTKLTGLLNKSNVNWKEVNSDQACSLGVTAIVSLLMQKWCHNRSMQHIGCCILMRVTQGDCGIERDVAESIHSSGRIETTMTAMKSFPNDDEIQPCNWQCISVFP